MLGDLASHFRNGFRERDALGADLHTVLGVAATGDAALLREDVNAFVCDVFSRGVHVEESRLADRSRAKEITVFRILRTSLHTASAGHALRELVRGLLVVRRNALPWAKIVVAVDRNPRLQLLECVKHPGAIHDQIPDHRELAHRLNNNGLLQSVDESTARLPHLSVDAHRAGAAHLFQAVRLPHHRSHLPALGVHRVLLDVHQAGDDV